VSLPEHVAEKLENLAEAEDTADKLRRELLSRREYTVGPIVITAGVTEREHQYIASFRVHLKDSHQFSWSEFSMQDARDLLAAREHFDRWLRNEENEPLPKPKTPQRI
jgi:hypothetical protein